MNRHLVLLCRCKDLIPGVDRTLKPWGAVGESERLENQIVEPVEPAPSNLALTPLHLGPSERCLYRVPGQAKQFVF
jgi:hypothetical protein